MKLSDLQSRRMSRGKVLIYRLTEIVENYDCETIVKSIKKVKVC